MPDLLLDTCALIWLAESSDRISEQTVSLINESNCVYTSAITAWEISLLCSKGQLAFSMPPEEWYKDFTRNQNIQNIDISPAIAFMSNDLPWHHRDPADRFILATAISQNLTIVSGDEKFTQYPVRVIK
ncbi:MAG: type II toxin-antitoxin system VapC family toxin [Proteobacteria bacterium]|nr:type II toxin-antitoxin system VapC family toxin [Pseudomonadota bacterium]